MRFSRLGAATLTAALLAAGCGGGESTGDGGGSLGGEIVLQDDVALDEDALVTTTTAASAETGTGGAAEGGSGDAAGLLDTITEVIPQDEESVEGEFFDSVGIFMGCMNVEAGGFAGVPDFGQDERDESQRRNQPDYIEAIQTCAARSDIVNTMEAAEDSSRFTAEEIEDRNRGFVVFRDCLIGRGWSIPEPSPDENGLLFSSYTEAATAWTPPGGETLFSTDDMTECGQEGNPLGIGGGEDDEESQE